MDEWFDVVRWHFDRLDIEYSPTTEVRTQPVEMARIHGNTVKAFVDCRVCAVEYYPDGSIRRIEARPVLRVSLANGR